MSKKDEILFLIKNLEAINEFDINNLSFQSEAALIRYFEVIGGTAKTLCRAGIGIICNDPIWKISIKTRDKIAHSYFSLDINILLNAIEDIPYLLRSANKLLTTLN